MDDAPNMICPKCGQFQPRASTCGRCGVVVAKLAPARVVATGSPTVGHHRPGPDGIVDIAFAWLRRRFPLIFGFLDARERMADSFDSVVPLAPFRRGLAVFGVGGLVLVLVSGLSLSRAPYELVYAIDEPEVRCRSGGGACEGVYRLTLGNVGEESLSDAVVVLRYGRFAAHVDPTRDPRGVLDRAVTGRRVGEVNRLTAQILEEMAQDGGLPGFADDGEPGDSERSWLLYEMKLEQLRANALRRARRAESTAAPDETLELVVGRLLPTHTQELRLTLSFDGESDVLPWSDVLARIDLPQGEVYEGHPRLGMLGRFLVLIGL